MPPTDLLPPARSTGGCETIPVFARWFGSWQVAVTRRAFSAGELTQAYDRSAADWQGAVARLGFPSAYEHALRPIAGRFPASGARPQVLDCGVGTGDLSLALSRASAAPFDLEGIDLSPAMLAEAGRRFRTDGVSATLRQGDMRVLPYDDATFDLVMTAHALEHVPDPQSALQDMVRVLRPGGQLMLCITRMSLPGLAIHMKWRTHRVTGAEAKTWLVANGLDEIRRLSLGPARLCRWFSLAFTATKPMPLLNSPLADEYTPTGLGDRPGQVPYDEGPL